MISSFVIRYHHDIVTRPVKVNVSVEQKNKKLYQQTIDLRYFQSPLQIEFEFNTLDLLHLVFETSCPDMDLFPFYVDRIELDGLVDVPAVVHEGKLVGNTKDDKTNCLYCSGSLIYTFKLPLCSVILSQKD